MRSKHKTQRGGKSGLTRQRISLPLLRRSCGGCTACCTAVGVTSLEKPFWATCRHQGEGHCRIYADRPTECREYRCGWLSGLLPEDMRPDQSGFLLSAQEDGMCVYILDDQPLDPILQKVAALDISTNKHGAVGTQLHPIHVHRLGQQIATGYSNPDNQGKSPAERKTLYSATVEVRFGKWFAFGNGPWRPVLDCKQPDEE